MEREKADITVHDDNHNFQEARNSNSTSSSSAGPYATPLSDDVNRTTRWTHNADDLVATITAVNAETGDQVTTNVWGTTLATSDVARNDLLTSVIFPDGGVMSSLFNRQNQAKETTDQRGVTRAFDRDLLGRQVEDRVIATEPSSSSSSSGTGNSSGSSSSGTGNSSGSSSSGMGNSSGSSSSGTGNSSGSSSSGGVPSGVDTTVLRIATTYDVRGMVQGKTSYDNPTVGEGTVVNDVLRVFNDFSQISTEYQEHTGTVNTSTSPAVGYQYADGSANTIRQTGMTYPNGRVLYADYGESGGMDDALSRVASLIDDDGTTHLADYTRIGLAGIVQVESPEPQIAWSLINGDGADHYSGLDQFDRVVDNRWFSTATSDDLDRIQHGYDRAGNRLWRKAPVAAAAGANLDELYAYDGVYRLKEMQRGELNGDQTAINSGTENFAQAWGLDATGNSRAFLEDDTGGGTWSLNQTRTHSEFNEIESITGGGWVQPAYDAAGSMTIMPQPAAPTAGFDCVYDAWNRMVSLWSGGSAVGVYRFDGINRRVSKLVSAVLRDIYYTAAWQAIEERLNGSTSPDRQFVCGLRYIDDLVLRDRGSERLYGIQDPNWNLTAVADATGTIQERYRYTTYGLPTVLTPGFTVRASSSFDWETLFAGYRWDVESGLYLSRHRFLDPASGVWVTRDPLVLSSLPGNETGAWFGDTEDDYDEIGGLRSAGVGPPEESGAAEGDGGIYENETENSYSYCAGNPLIATDPSGLLIDTIADVCGLGYDIYEFCDEPSWGGFGMICWSGTAMCVPFLPGSWAGRAGKGASRVARAKKSIKPTPPRRAGPKPKPQKGKGSKKKERKKEKTKKKKWRCTTKPRGDCSPECQRPFVGYGDSRGEAVNASEGACQDQGCHTPGPAVLPGKPYSCDCGHTWCQAPQ